MIQCLRLHTFNAGNTYSVPGRGTKIPHATAFSLFSLCLLAESEVPVHKRMKNHCYTIAWANAQSLAPFFSSLVQNTSEAEAEARVKPEVEGHVPLPTSSSHPLSNII